MLRRVLIASAAAAMLLVTFHPDDAFARLVDTAGQHHFIVMAIKAKLAETSTPSLAPRSSSTTPFSLRNLTPETSAATAAPPPTPA